jgi:glycosyltransferase involved in cell wall biosynthesis
VNTELFERAFISLKNQTIGFENIEWVIVSHNSAPENTESIRAMVGTYPNVKIEVLKNDKKTPSSPRNHAFDFASGEYVGFLDADDWFEPDTFEKALRRVKEAEADIAVFRFMPVADDDKHQPIQPYVLIDQTKELIVVERGNWDSRTFIYGAGLSIWTKIYRREFLNEHGLRFDEDVPFAEDNLFNLDCFNKAKRICFLPQLIGYNYFLHGGGMVQSFNKTADEAIRYAKGIVKIFDRGLSCGLYMNNVMWDLLAYESAIILASVNLTLDERKEISALLSPYLKMMEKIEVSKLYSERMAKIIMSLPKIVIGHPKLIYNFAKLMKALKVDIGSKIKV